MRSIGIPAGVITNGNHQQQVSEIRRIGLERLIDRVFSSELTGFAEPDARAFLLPCRSMDVQSAATLNVGDNYLTDVAGARNAGLRAIHLRREGRESPESIDSLEGSLEGVIKLTSIEAAN
ncbi:putative hydrolase of the HAD superfamily [Paenarthrobacter nicotinovorans]|uniref:HAD family hydrolase n=1 Tax=Micrococcaceae TaxID=1268 RepID=UPI0008765B35|nr:putative hydrolase of the HAD superfamily [Paenarthrobacter nicotinovorans]SCZ61372.1 haloacid dehalogenase superfamily, subfamily IA, variant 1 with third motif having Dx(3-4)D or Dx(3-4)E [Arthrobacter sp. UNCCL28]